MTTMEVVLIAAAIVAALVVLVKLWINVIVPTWEALVRMWDKTVEVWEWTVDAVGEVIYFIREAVDNYIIYPIKSVKRWYRRKYLQTDLENIIEDRDMMRESADKIQSVVNMGYSDQSNVDMLRDGADQIDEMLIEAGLIEEGE